MGRHPHPDSRAVCGQQVTRWRGGYSGPPPEDWSEEALVRAMVCRGPYELRVEEKDGPGIAHRVTPWSG